MCELKPCPFCGSTRISGVTSSDDSRLFREFVCCEDCGASTTTHETKEQAVSAWNARAERTCHMNAIYLEGYIEAIECSACRWFRIHDHSEPLPDLCPNCFAKVVEE